MFESVLQNDVTICYLATPTFSIFFVSWEGKTVPMKSVENTEQVEPPWRFATRWCPQKKKV